MSDAGKQNKAASWLISIVLSAVLAPLLIFAGPTGVQAEISQVPLFLTVEVEPNIVFVIDDSGSMHFETLPDEVSMDTFGGLEWWHRGVFYMFPPADRIYGGDTDYWRSSTYRGFNLHNIPGFGATDRWAAFFRSHHNNAMYYNPQTRYLPWVSADGTPWPDADPGAAYHNPADTGKGSRNLTANNWQYACWINPTASTWTSNWGLCSSESRSFYPATYFNYQGGNVNEASSYERIEVKAGNAPFAGGPKRTDCADPDACTYEEEIQNFANWYTYHRSRILTSRGGIGRAFAAQGEDIRVGYGTINAGSSYLDSEASPGTMVRGVRAFSGSDREEFFSLLYERDIPLSGTPLRRALDDAGQYYTREDARGPWNTTPGAAGGSNLACRNSYTVLMTDGYWNVGNEYAARHSSRRANVDNQDGPSILNPVPLAENFQYTPEPPYQDDWSDTLADVAMYYWNRDLCPNISNRVPTSVFNEAYWQSMVTFGVGLGVSGTLDQETDLDSLKSGDLDWPDPTTDATPRGAKIDDLWHASLNSRGDFFSAMDPEIFSEKLGGLLAALVDRKTGTAAAIATNSTRLIDNTLIYQARFDSETWSGQILAYNINSDGSVGEVEWNTNDSGKIPAHGDRRIFTWNGTDGVPFTVAGWDNLSSGQRTDLRAGGSEDQGKDRLNWLRGDQSMENDQAGGYLRPRDHILGDIVNSDPLIVGAPDFQYQDLPAGTPGKETYKAFRIDNAARTRLLYIGGNDGMLHAFDANTGVEQFAYVPAASSSAGLANLSDPDYVHRYYVDGSPNVGDAYLDDSWKTILIGTMGVGGRSVFALDVTDPDNFDESDILWEFSHPDMGYAIGKPVLARLQNGQWAVVFGNGYGGDSDRAQLFIVNAQSGELIRRIDTGAGSAGDPNGLSVPALLTDAHRTLTTAYAGDLHGNLWKFDLSDELASNWDIPFVTNPGAVRRPLFTARDNSGQVQPMTAPLELGAHPEGGVMVYFGTGKYFEVGDNIVGADPPVQSFYGIWDNDSRIPETDRSSLVSQTILAEGVLHDTSDDQLRAVTENPVDYNATPLPQRGWFVDLVSPVAGLQGERVVSAPVLRRGRVIFSTLIPLADPCSAGGTSWLMELDAVMGARLIDSVFDVNDDTDIDDDDKITIIVDGKTVTVAASGIQSRVGIIKTPAVIEAGELEYKYFGGSEGGIAVVREKGGDANELGRRSWRQLR
jgi:type IV pilus assembly protein PilY1